MRVVGRHHAKFVGTFFPESGAADGIDEQLQPRVDIARADQPGGLRAQGIQCLGELRERGLTLLQRATGVGQRQRAH